jgi:hypothetical protein
MTAAVILVHWLFCTVLRWASQTTTLTSPKMTHPFTKRYTVHVYSNNINIHSDGEFSP